MVLKKSWTESFSLCRQEGKTACYAGSPETVNKDFDRHTLRCRDFFSLANCCVEEEKTSNSCFCACGTVNPLGEVLNSVSHQGVGGAPLMFFTTV